VKYSPEHSKLSLLYWNSYFFDVSEASVPKDKNNLDSQIDRFQPFPKTLQLPSKAKLAAILCLF